MKDYIDRLNAAHNSREHREVTRDLLGMQDFNVGSFIGGWVAGALLGKGISDIVGGIAESRRSRFVDDHDSYYDPFDY